MSDLEGLQAYHVNEHTPLYDTTKFVYNRPDPIEFNAAALLARVSTLEVDNAALKAAVARLEAIVNAIREYGEL